MYEPHTYKREGYKVFVSANKERVIVTLNDGRSAEAWTEEEALQRALEKHSPQ